MKFIRTPSFLRRSFRFHEGCPMKILAIETATDLGGVAVIEDEKLLAECRMDMPMAHAERLMVTVDRVLKECGLTMEDINALAVSIGPGSFTGLRVAVS